MLVIRIKLRKQAWAGKYGRQKVADIIVVRVHRGVTGPVVEKVGFISKVYGDFPSFAFLNLDRVGFWLNRGAKVQWQVLLIMYWLAFYEFNRG